MDAKRLALEVRVAPGTTARADREKVQQIVINLLSNALKFTPVGGRVRLDARPVAEPARVRLRVADTGIGIPPEKQASVFDPFVQVDMSRTRRSEGSGLGLAISRDLARGMGGDLEVESTVGEGSTFTLWLPAEG
jgi:signal transduction histidine kinase